jgi:hypothetical protein
MVSQIDASNSFSRNGQRILVNHSSNPAGTGRAAITVVLNWTAGLTK